MTARPQPVVWGHAPACAAQRGLALIMVLWATALMTLLAASFAFSLRTEARLATTFGERATAAAAAEAGIQRLLASLLARDRRSRGALYGEMVFDGLDVALSATPENARIDLNAAPPALLLGLMEYAVAQSGSTDATAAAITDAVLDWRDADDNPRPDGAEAAEYEGAAVHPRNGAFLSVTELGQVRGVNPELLRVLEPLVTVHAWSPQVDAMSASRPILLALPGVEPAQVDAFIEAREEGPAALALLSGGGRFVARSGSTVYSLVARARAGSGVTVSRRLVVKLNNNVKRPVSVLAWFADAGPETRADDPLSGDPAAAAQAR